MMQHVSSIICKKVIIDSLTNVPSFIEVISGATLNLPEIPGKAPDFTLFSMLLGKLTQKAQKHSYSVVFVDPSGTEKIISKAEIPIKKGGKGQIRSNVCLDIIQLAIEEEGIHWFNVNLGKGKKKITVAELPVRVVLAKKKEQDKRIKTKKVK